MKRLIRSNLIFSTILSAWSGASLLTLVFAIILVTRLDVTFFESNGMIQNPQLREAIYFKIFLSIEGWLFAFLALSFVSVFVISYLFAKSEHNYFYRVADAIAQYAQTMNTPSTTSMGDFNPHITYFFEVLEARVKKEPNDKLQTTLERALRDWPQRPVISWRDQAQFGVVAFLLALLYAVIAVIFFWNVNEEVVSLSNQLVRFKTATGPEFLNEQYRIVNLITYTVISVTIAAFITTGLRFGQRISNASYAVLRDLKKFMLGDFDHRVFLRRNDPGEDAVPKMNESLLKIADRIRSAR